MEVVAANSAPNACRVDESLLLTDISVQWALKAEVFVRRPSDAILSCNEAASSVYRTQKHEWR